MRTYTIVFSIFAHALAVGALIIVPALATDDLPEPRRTTAFIVVRPELPPSIPPRVARNEAVPSLTSPVPLAPPDGVPPETIVEPVGHIGPDLGDPLKGILQEMLLERRTHFPAATSASPTCP